MAITYIYIGIAFTVGFLLAWVLRTINLARLKKLHKSTSGYLESETLKKETLQKEVQHAHQSKMTVETSLKEQLEKAQKLHKRMDEDILLLQKSNEETETLLQATAPEVHALKLKLIEANNTIARLKGERSSPMEK
jgi:biopolymer transport protein ExbB/TolQ